MQHLQGYRQDSRPDAAVMVDYVGSVGVAVPGFEQVRESHNVPMGHRIASLIIRMRAAFAAACLWWVGPADVAGPAVAQLREGPAGSRSFRWKRRARPVYPKPSFLLEQSASSRRMFRAVCKGTIARWPVCDKVKLLWEIGDFYGDDRRCSANRKDVGVTPGTRALTGNDGKRVFLSFEDAAMRVALSRLVNPGRYAAVYRCPRTSHHGRSHWHVTSLVMPRASDAFVDAVLLIASTNSFCVPASAQGTNASGVVWSVPRQEVLR